QPATHFVRFILHRSNRNLPESKLMNNLDPNQPMLDRRAFLKGSVSVVGLSILSLSPGSALARTLAAPAVGQDVVLAFWNGQRFVDAERLASGDTTLQN